MTRLIPFRERRPPLVAVAALRAGSLARRASRCDPVALPQEMSCAPASPTWGTLRILEADGGAPRDVVLPGSAFIVVGRRTGGRRPEADVAMDAPFASSAHCIVRTDLGPGTDLPRVWLLGM